MKKVGWVAWLELGMLDPAFWTLAYPNKCYMGTSPMKKSPPWNPTVGLCLGPYDGPRGWGFFQMGEVPLHRYSSFPFPQSSTYSSLSASVVIRGILSIDESVRIGVVCILETVHARTSFLDADLSLQVQSFFKPPIPLELIVLVAIRKVLPIDKPV